MRLATALDALLSMLPLPAPRILLCSTCKDPLRGQAPALAETSNGDYVIKADGRLLCWPCSDAEWEQGKHRLDDWLRWLRHQQGPEPVVPCNPRHHRSILL